MTTRSSDLHNYCDRGRRIRGDGEGREKAVHVFDIQDAKAVPGTCQIMHRALAMYLSFWGNPVYG